MNDKKCKKVSTKADIIVKEIQHRRKGGSKKKANIYFTP
jgi:hypothetical protein